MEVRAMKSNVGRNWNTVRLGDVCEVIGGYAFKSESFRNVGIPLLRISNILDTEISFKDDCVCIEDNNLSKLQRYKVVKGDILVALSGATTGKFGEYKLNDLAYLNQRVGLIRTTEKMNQKYLLFYLNILKPQIEQIAQGAAQPNISTSEIENIEIPLPPLATQKRIAEILDAADALRRKDQELLKKYDELAQAIFIDMFGDPVKNEKGWEVKKFNDLGTLDRGVSKHRPRNAPELLGGIYPLIQTGDVANSGGVITKYKATYSEFGLRQSKLWSKGTLCITIAANIAKTGILSFDACFPDSIVGFNPNRNISNSVFIQYWIGFLQKILEDNAPESAQKNINLEILRGLDVICPPIELQDDFENKIDLLKSIIEKSSNYNDGVLFESLIQKAFKGELVN